MNECEKNIALISLAVDGMLSDEEMLSLENHIQGCEECRNRLIDYQSMTSTLESLTIDPPDSLHTNIMHAIGREDCEEKRKAPSYRFSFMTHLLPAALALIAVLFIAANPEIFKAGTELNDTAIAIQTSSEYADDAAPMQPVRESAALSDTFGEFTLEKMSITADSYRNTTQTDAENTKQVSGNSGIEEKSYTENNPYLNQMYSFLILAKFEDVYDQQAALTSDLFENCSYEYISEYDSIFVSVSNSSSALSDISLELPSLGASCEVFSDESYDWYDSSAPYGLVILTSQN